jgi:fructosamine-3-kinase
MMRGGVQAAIAAALRETGIDSPIREVRDLAGGCIHAVMRIELADGRAVVAKCNVASMISAFREETAGLAALDATATVLVPRTLGASVQGDAAVLLMTCLEPGRVDDAAWRRLGEELATLHRADPVSSGRYGFDMDNHLGATPQINAWCDDWVTFNAVNRLGFQVRSARDGGRLDAGESARLEALIGRLDRLIPRRPKPALLHGDLWSGNALPSIDERGRARIAVIDPAVSIGDGWADIAMMKLFGGFPPACYEAYAARVDDREGIEQRIAVYQLYHVLNHVNLFGRGYVGQAMGLVAGLE